MTNRKQFSRFLFAVTIPSLSSSAFDRTLYNKVTTRHEQQNSSVGKQHTNAFRDRIWPAHIQLSSLCPTGSHQSYSISIAECLVRTPYKFYRQHWHIAILVCSHLSE